MTIAENSIAALDNETKHIGGYSIAIVQQQQKLKNWGQ